MRLACKPDVSGVLCVHMVHGAMPCYPAWPGAARRQPELNVALRKAPKASGKRNFLLCSRMISEPPVFLAHAAPASLFRTGSSISNLVNLNPPLGLLSIAAYLRERGRAVELVDFYAYPRSIRDFRERLLRIRPHWLGVSCTTSTFNGGIMLARIAREVLPEVRIVFGGPHVSALREVIIDRYPVIDAVVAGEGEETFSRLLSQGIESAPGIPGLVCRDADGRACFTGFRREHLEMDLLPYPAYDGLKSYPGRYSATIFNYPRGPGASIVSSRGCPYACSYCDRSVFGRSFRYNSAEYLHDHMLHLRESYGVRHLTFYDDQFTFNRERVVELCRRLIKRPAGMTFNCAVRAEHVDGELLHLMKRAGCWMVSLGIETGDPGLLARHRRGAGPERLADCIALIKAAGLRAKGLFMMGLPGETEESIMRTREYVFSLPLDDLNLTKFTPFPGPPLYAEAGELGTFEEDWDRMDCMSFLFVPNGLTRERLEELYSAFYRSYFMRPEVWLHYMKMAFYSPDSWRRFLANAGDYFKFAFRRQTTDDGS